MKGKKKSKLQQAQDKAQAAINLTNKTIEELGSHTSGLYESLTSIQELFDKIRNVPSDKKLQYEELKQIRLNWKQQAVEVWPLVKLSWLWRVRLDGLLRECHSWRAVYSSGRAAVIKSIWRMYSQPSVIEM